MTGKLKSAGGGQGTQHINVVEGHSALALLTCADSKM
jgi:hypothetical protein